jgi:hypothetical protein
MPQKSEYRVVSGTNETIGQLIAPLAAQGFKPILMTSTGVTVSPQVAQIVMISLVLERVLGT